MAHDVFISHASRDKAIADAVCAKLESRHIRCWIAPRDVAPGRAYADEIIGALNACRMVVVLLSSESISSAHVASELERALHNGKAILPVRIEDVHPTGSMEYYLAGKHWLDALTPPMEAHLEKVADAAGRLLGVEVKREPAPIAEAAPPQPVKPSGIQARKLYKDAKALMAAGEYAQALPHLRQALAIYRALSDEAGAALCMGEIAFSLKPTINPAGNWDEVLDNYRAALAWFESAGDRVNQIAVLGNLAFALSPENNPAGNWKEAIDTSLKQATVAAGAGQRDDEAQAVWHAALWLMPTRNSGGDWAESAILFRRAADLYQALGDGKSHGIGLHNEALCRIAGKEVNLTDETRQLFSRAAQVLRAAGCVKEAEKAEQFAGFGLKDTSGNTAATETLAQAATAQNAKQWPQAAVHFQQAAELFAATGDLAQQALCLHNQAWCQEPLRNPAGDWATCIALYRKSAALRAEAGDRGGQFASLRNLSLALYPSRNLAGDWAEAQAIAELALELARKAGDRMGEADCLNNLGFIQMPGRHAEGSWDKAIDYFKAALPLYAAAGDSENKAAVLWNLAVALNPRKNPGGDWSQSATCAGQASEAYLASGQLRDAGVCMHECAVALIRADSANLTDEAWQMFRRAAQYLREAGDLEGARISEAWIH